MLEHKIFVYHLFRQMYRQLALSADFAIKYPYVIVIKSAYLLAMVIKL